MLEEAQRILAWIKTRPLHFDQSATRALGALLEEKGIPYTRKDLAVKLVLIDILVGVMTPYSGPGKLDQKPGLN